MENKNILISVIITTYNRSVYLNECLMSIQNQTFENIEILVVDDGSCETIAIENKIICNQFSKCKYYYKENTGQPDSRNYGIKRSKGAFIAFCDDDDYWVLDKLEQQFEVFENNANLYFVTGCIGYIDESGNVLDEIKCHKGFNQGQVFKYLLEKNRTSSITPMLKREVFDKVGYFNSNFTIAEDWDFWRKVSYFYEFHNTNTVLAYVRKHTNNMSKNSTRDPLEFFLLYRKLTKSLLSWGENYFSNTDLKRIYSTEYKRYKKLFTNHCPGIRKKMQLLFRIIRNDFGDLIHLFKLYFKFVTNEK